MSSSGKDSRISVERIVRKGEQGLNIFLWEGISGL